MYGKDNRKPTNYLGNHNVTNATNREGIFKASSVLSVTKPNLMAILAQKNPILICGIRRLARMSEVLLLPPVTSNV